MALYFAYGLTMDRERMASVCPNAKTIGTASLSGYTLEFTHPTKGHGEGITNISLDRYGVVNGVVYDIPNNEIAMLDTHEGVPDLYKRIAVDVVDVDGRTVRAISHQIVKEVGYVRPARDYIAAIVKAAEKNMFSEGYLSYLRQF